MALLLLTTVLQAYDTTAVSGTGREWMVIFSVVVPAVLLFVLIYLGRRTV
jgi:hypothetical protein